LKDQGFDLQIVVVANDSGPLGTVSLGKFLGNSTRTVLILFWNGFLVSEQFLNSLVVSKQFLNSLVVSKQFLK
jgi:hypothetical protein